MTLTSADIKNLKPSIEEYHEIDWNDVYDLTNPDCEYSNLYLNNKFENQLKLCLEQNNPNRAKIFQILSIVTSPLLSDPKNRDNPYIPHMNFNGIRSHLLDDLSDDDIEFLKEIVSDIKTTALKARINDTLWLRVKNVKYAEEAIIAYSNYPLNTTDFKEYFSHIAFMRAIYLSNILKKRGEKYLKNIIDRLYHSLIDVHIDETEYSLKLSEILRDDRNSLPKERIENIRQKLDIITNSCNELQISGQCYEETIKWYKICKKENEIPRLHSEYVQRLEISISQDIEENQDIGAHTAYKIEIGIQKLREIPQKRRLEFNVDERINQLLQLKDKACLALNRRMTVTSINSINITDICQSVRLIFTEKSLDDAIRMLCINIHQIKKSTLHQEAKKCMKYPRLSNIIPINIVDSYGHKIVTINPPNFNDLDAAESQPAINYRMVLSYITHISIVVNSYILPALEIINKEHRISEEYIENLVTKCPFIQKDRKTIWIKGLYAGFNHDYLISAHLLVPQFEHLIRHILREKNIPTTQFDSKDKTETEMALGSLFYDVGTSEIEKFFGEDLYFELRTLLVDKTGPNLRNKIAHGLINNDEFYSEPTIYFWWICLSIVFVTGYKI